MSFSSQKEDNLLCCMLDIDGCNNAGVRSSKCNADYTNQTSPNCRLLLADYCTGKDIPTGQSNIWIDRWTSNETLTSISGTSYTFYRPCYYNIYRNLYDGQPTACVDPAFSVASIPNTQGYNYDEDLLDLTLTKYIEAGGNLAANEGTEANVELNEIFYNICSRTPGLCKTSLTNYCAGVTANDIKRNPNLLKWCACYMAPEQYIKYTDLYQISRECTPTCNMSGVIPLPSEDGNCTKLCKQTTCVIDDVSIDISASSSQNVDFTQICGSCSGGANGVCNCTITNGNFITLDGKTGNIDISQQCSSQNSACYIETIDENGKIVNQKVPCTETIPTDYTDQEELNKESAIRQRNLIMFLIFFIVLVIIAVVWCILAFTTKTVTAEN